LNDNDDVKVLRFIAWTTNGSVHGGRSPPARCVLATGRRVHWSSCRN